MQTCPICGGGGLVVFVPVGDGGENEQDQPCTECGEQGQMKGSRARRAGERVEQIHAQLLSRRFGRQASRWRVR